jgi:medium-chain acyl-[acyl-carrier-protein] hydrolase
MVRLRIESTPWFDFHKLRAKAHLRLFCFPYAGGSASTYKRWADLLPPQIEVAPVQLPGRGQRISEPPRQQLEPLLYEIVQALEPWLDVPYALFGHSMGGMIAFEFARRMVIERGPTPVHVTISGRSGKCCGSQIASSALDDDADILRRVRDLKGATDELLDNPEALALFLPIFRADFGLLRASHTLEGPKLSCPVRAIGGLRDPHVTREGLEYWATQTTGPFALSMVCGDHFFIHSAESDVLEIVRRDLSQILRVRAH